MKKIALALVFFLTVGSIIPPADASSLYGEKSMFTITGYYSPLPDQSFYITGDYASEIALNGRGIHGADGTPVFPGMIAAPKSFSFGTKIRVPGFGVGEVRDRGGAIVEKGQRDLARHDRLDIWMGYGEEGLRRALSFGVQHLECDVFPETAPVEVSVNFDIPPMLRDIINLPERYVFARNLSRGLRGDDIKKLQEGLNQLGLFGGLIDGVFDDELEEAVFAFQEKYFIIESEDDAGAGIFGPRTREKFSQVLYDQKVQKTIQEAWEKFHFDEDMQRGHRNASVLKLQQILVEQEFMDVLPTGFFGPKTEEALIQFQLAYGVIRNTKNSGAGKVGPSTREKLNEILEEKKNFLSEEKIQVLAYKKINNTFQVLAGNSVSSSLSQK